MELFEPTKQTLRTKKGRFATENQHLRSENERLRNELELERRKQPTWREIRKFNQNKL